MTGRPYRLPAGKGGRLIDRSRPLSFRFDGSQHNGFAGDTLASALMASGRRVLGRSFKYHRPRGLVGLGAEEMNALVGVGEGARHEPNLRAAEVELHDGLVAVSQNRWPSVDFDIGAVSGMLSRFFPAGFYYKTFMWPRAFWKAVYEPVIRRAAGLGKAPTAGDPDRYEQVHLHCDVLVVGGGVTGIAAAEAAAASGGKVVLCDDHPHLGGVADIWSGTIDGKPQVDWARDKAAALAAAPNVHILTRTTAIGHYEDNFVLLVERVAKPANDVTAPRHRLWKVRAHKVVLATGAIERPIAFYNNDRPGVMLSTTARAMVERYGVAPGVTGVVFTNNDDAYRTAITLKQAGVGVARVVDSRADVKSPAIEEARAAGLDVMTGAAVSAVETGFGGLNIEAVRVAPYRAGRGRVVDETRIGCDFVAVSGGFNPAVHLWCHNGGRIAFDGTLHAFRPKSHGDAIRAAGAANGSFRLADCLSEGYAAGEAAGANSGAPRAVRSTAASAEQAPLQPLWFSPATGSHNEGNKHFVDLQNDVTVADLELAQREGYSSVEHTKRYTTWGMATDQGKTSNIIGLGALSEATGKPIPEIGITTFRPPFTPLSFGAISGSKRGPLFLPVRRTCAFGWHEANGADFEPVGLWRRPYCYPRAGEDRKAAVDREILAVRRRVGLLDASTLGKIEIKGPDAAEFLDRMYSNTYSTLKVGRGRYGLMLNELGFITDDGVTVRLGEDHYLMHTTSGGADRIAAWLEEWLQTEWPNLKVFVTPVTEQWAQFAVAGPKARDVLETMDGDIDFAPEALPFLGYAAGRLAGHPVRVYRISFSGELSFEIATPADRGRALWDDLLSAGQTFGMEPYGTEALHVLRAEKGFIVVGDETDGTTTPDDVGLGGLVSKKKRDFLGKRSLELAHMKAPNRKQLVGLFTEDPKEVLPDGAHAVEQLKEKPPMRTIGHVTSTYWSPTIERSIAMALIENGRARMGQTLDFPLAGKTVRAKVVDHVFYDKEGARQNV